jgi:hypothetical protein
MKVLAAFLMLYGMVLAHSAVARAEDASSNFEFALMPSAADVTLLNEGGKFVPIDLKKNR